MGRKVRLFTPDQRRALIARDRGCAAPSCTIPAPWCDAHHVIPWKAGGSTSVANAVLLCSHHHHTVHAGMWTIQLTDGVAWFTPRSEEHTSELQSRFDLVCSLLLEQKNIY